MYQDEKPMMIYGILILLFPWIVFGLIIGILYRLAGRGRLVVLALAVIFYIVLISGANYNGDLTVENILIWTGGLIAGHLIGNLRIKTN